MQGWWGTGTRAPATWPMSTPLCSCWDLLRSPSPSRLSLSPSLPRPPSLSPIFPTYSHPPHPPPHPPRPLTTQHHQRAAAAPTKCHTLPPPPPPQAHLPRAPKSAATTAAPRARGPNSHTPVRLATSRKRVSTPLSTWISAAALRCGVQTVPGDAGGVTGPEVAVLRLGWVGERIGGAVVRHAFQVWSSIAIDSF
jgi:hypothetical protein